jgi:hypothetical protein
MLKPCRDPKLCNDCRLSEAALAADTESEGMEEACHVGTGGWEPPLKRHYLYVSTTLYVVYVC